MQRMARVGTQQARREAGRSTRYVYEILFCLNKRKLNETKYHTHFVSLSFFVLFLLVYDYVMSAGPGLLAAARAFAVCHHEPVNAVVFAQPLAHFLPLVMDLCKCI